MIFLKNFFLRTLGNGVLLIIVLQNKDLYIMTTAPQASLDRYMSWECIWKWQTKLVIVESPAKAKTIQKFLGKSYKVIASNGHVRDLPKSSMGIDFENDFEPKYITIREKERFSHSFARK